MKPGRTANIRISPKDCMSCIDVVQKTGVNLQGASFTIIVSAALSSLLESMRQAGVIPVRDGFEYAQMMGSYPKQGKANHARALAITKTFQVAMPSGHMPAVAHDPVMKRKKARFQELAQKNEIDPLNMDEAEKIEMQTLLHELNPL